ncbi:DUF4436 family protein [Amycolatopsis anabasis]|uniref:DUF4436 family protein n=1 Tax=Amycolatopsis anabasis TaxID=1840409 RepID=UPI001C5516B7|nr:DUF4436 family protein [Amycolatopsis anabasis]
MPASAKKILIAVVIVLLTVGSVATYFAERRQGQSATVAGDTRSPNRVDLTLLAQKLDPATMQLSTQLELEPQGTFSDSGVPSTDLTVYTTGTKGDAPVFKAGQMPGQVDLKLPLWDGTLADYPFDSYRTGVALYVATADGIPVPASVTFVNADSFFRFTNEETTADEGGASLFVHASRSTGTLAFALFAMLLMWLMSLMAVLAAWFVISGRKGLLWPSMSFMGVVLFALIPLRNTMPGQPPIGSLLDFGAFFLAEALIALSLITTVIVGYRVERSEDGPSAEPPTATTSEPEQPPHDPPTEIIKPATITPGAPGEPPTEFGRGD